MCALFHSRVPEVFPAVEPVPSEFPVIDGAEIAATTYGARVAGDFYDSLRVGPERILFGLLDGRWAPREQSAHPLGRAKGFSHFGLRTVCGLRSQRIRCHGDALSSTQSPSDGSRGGVHSCPASWAAITRNLAPSATPMPGIRRGSCATLLALSNFRPPACRSACSRTPPATLPRVGNGKRCGSSAGFAGVVEGKCKDEQAEESGIRPGTGKETPGCRRFF